MLILGLNKTEIAGTSPSAKGHGLKKTNWKHQISPSTCSLSNNLQIIEQLHEPKRVGLILQLFDNLQVWLEIWSFHQGKINQLILI